MAATIIATANSKGGVSKTITTLNLGVELARRAGPVLLVDFDPQASLTQMLGIVAETHNMADVLGITSRGTLEIAPIIVTTSAGLDLAPSDILLSRTEMTLIVRPAHEQQLARALEPIEVILCFADCVADEARSRISPSFAPALSAVPEARSRIDCTPCENLSFISPARSPSRPYDDAP